MTRKIALTIGSACLVICSTTISVRAETEPFVYHENFESRSLNAWVSYPLWQDTAYDDNFTVGEMIPGDSNLSITQLVNTYEPGECLAGAQKKIDFHLAPDFRLEARYYLKSHLPVRSMTIRIAARSLGALDVMIPSPPVNRWERITVTFNDIVAANPAISGMGSVRAYGIAFLAAVEHADPSMPLWFGLDDVVIRARRTPGFRFITPATVKYAEWKEHISLYPLRRGDKLSIKGDWLLLADRVRMAVSPLSNGTSVLMDIPLRNAGGIWVLDGVPLNFGKGIYRGVLTAFRDTVAVGTTEFTFTILPEKTGGVHPRLWFDNAGRDTIRKKLGEERYAGIGREIATESARMRTAFPAERSRRAVRMRRR